MKGRHGQKKEFRLLEGTGYYDKGPHSEALNSKLMHSLKRRERVFLIRLLEWRRSLAEKRNHSKEMVLSSKYIAQIVKGISSGKDALFQNRRLPSKVVERHGDIFESLYRQEISDEEQTLLKRIPAEIDEDPRETIVIEMLYQVIKYKCMEDEMSINLALPAIF